jgi:tetratricopeptide (TPR) repeat protein
MKICIYLLYAIVVLNSSVGVVLADDKAPGASSTSDSASTSKAPEAVKAKLESLIFQADALFKKNEVDSASTIYQQAFDECNLALKADPNQAEVMQAKSKCLMRISFAQAKVDKALAAQSRSLALSVAESAVQQAPDNISILLWRADCLLRCAYEESVSKKREVGAELSKQAIACYDRCISISPSATAYNGKAHALILEDYCLRGLSFAAPFLDEAVENFDLAIKAGDNSADLYISRGKILIRLSKFNAEFEEARKSKILGAKAVESFSRAIDLEPKCGPSIQEELSTARMLAAGTFRDKAKEKRVKKDVEAIKRSLNSPDSTK